MKYITCKLPKSGLCNKLFPWARGLVLAKKMGIYFVRPQFAQIKIGPILRRERDLRLYADLFYPRSIAEVSHSLRAGFLKKFPEDALENFSEARSGNLVVTDLGDYFGSIHEYPDLIAEHLWSLTRMKWRKATSRSIPTLAVHIRLGDFSGHIRHPIEWYIQAINYARSVTGMCDVGVFSDGSDHEIESVLNLKNVHRIDTGSAISDLFMLSKARFIIATGSSSFSAWASFLGSVPAMTRVGNPLSWWNLYSTDKVFRGELDMNSPNLILQKTLEEIRQ